MDRPDDAGSGLANAAFACSVLVLPLWLFSFSWVPFALTGREVGSVWYIILAGEVSALLAAVLAIGLGVVARRHASAGSAVHRRASRGLIIGTTALVLIVGLNALGLVFT